jgi:plastocyanin
MKRTPLVNLSLILLFAFTISLTGPSFGTSREIKQTASSENNQSHSKQVNIDNFSFTPAALTVPVGTNVTWVNHDDVPHLIMNTDKRFVSPPLDTDDRFSYTFASPGTYDYYCSIHPKMTAKIIVK